MPTLNSEGTLTADGSEQDLGTVSVNGYYNFSVNLSNMAAADVVKIRFYKKVKTTGTLARFHVETYNDAQTTEPESPVVDSGPFWIANEFKVTLQQTAGTNRNFDWEILSS